MGLGGGEGMKRGRTFKLLKEELEAKGFELKRIKDKKGRYFYILTNGESNTIFMSLREIRAFVLGLEKDKKEGDKV